MKVGTGRDGSAGPPLPLPVPAPGRPPGRAAAAAAGPGPGPGRRRAAPWPRVRVAGWSRGRSWSRSARAPPPAEPPQATPLSTSPAPREKRRTTRCVRGVGTVFPGDQRKACWDPHPPAAPRGHVWGQDAASSGVEPSITAAWNSTGKAPVTQLDWFQLGSGRTGVSPDSSNRSPPHTGRHLQVPRCSQLWGGVPCKLHTTEQRGNHPVTQHTGPSSATGTPEAPPSPLPTSNTERSELGPGCSQLWGGAM